MSDTTTYTSRAEVLATDGYLGHRPAHRVVNLLEADAADPARFNDLDIELEKAHNSSDFDLLAESNWQLLVTDQGQFLRVGNTVLAVGFTGEHAIEINNDASIYDEHVDLTDDRIALDALGVFLPNTLSDNGSQYFVA